MAIFHVTVAAVGRGTMFLDPAAAWRARRRLLRCVGRCTALFAQADDHGHLVVSAEPGRATVKTPHVEPVTRRSHLASLPAYLARQPTKHGLAHHPALWADGCAGDLLGIRCTPCFDPTRLGRWLPRWRAEALAAELGVGSLAPLGPEAAAAWAPGALVVVAGKVFDTPMSGRTAPAVRARRALMRVGLEAGIRRVVLAEALGVARQTASDLVREGAPDADVEMIRRRLAVIRQLGAK